MKNFKRINQVLGLAMLTALAACGGNDVVGVNGYNQFAIACGANNIPGGQLLQTIRGEDLGYARIELQIFGVPGGQHQIVGNLELNTNALPGLWDQGTISTCVTGVGYLQLGGAGPAELSIQSLQGNGVQMMPRTQSWVVNSVLEGDFIISTPQGQDLLRF